MTMPFDPDRLYEAMKALRAIAMPDDAKVLRLRSDSRALRKLLLELSAAKEHLHGFERVIDHILVPSHIFDMANPETVGEVIVYKLEQQAKEPLPRIEPFYGSGVYALYYHGDHTAYQAITGTNCPIYVGSAGPKTPNAPSAKPQGTKLFDRITEHLDRSIRQSAHLQDEHFHCRYLVVQSGLEKAAEDFLIRLYQPAWNKESKVCSGIGKHGDKARAELSDWDVLHGGRRWAGTQTSRSGKTSIDVEANILSHFRGLLSGEPAKWGDIFNASWVAQQE